MGKGLPHGRGALPRGFQFGGYALERCVGRGAMARVYRAEHVALQKTVALKIQEAGPEDSDRAHERFLREARVLASIEHPNVVDVSDVGVRHGIPYLVMEFLQGRTLADYLEQNAPLDDRRIAELMLPIIAGLVAVHRAGIVHRDLKPENIFLAKRGDGQLEPKLLDFGISKFTRHGWRAITDAGQIMGTPNYVSPEGLHGAQHLTEKSDQYSLGVILYECATGKPVFDKDSMEATFYAIAKGDFERPSARWPGVSADMEAIILRCMQLDPLARFRNTADVGRALLKLAGTRVRALFGPSFGVYIDSVPPLARLQKTSPRLRGISTLPPVVRSLSHSWSPFGSRPGLRTALLSGCAAVVTVSAITALLMTPASSDVAGAAVSTPGSPLSASVELPTPPVERSEPESTARATSPSPPIRRGVELATLPRVSD